MSSSNFDQQRSMYWNCFALFLMIKYLLHFLSLTCQQTSMYGTRMSILIFRGQCRFRLLLCLTDVLCRFSKSSDSGGLCGIVITASRYPDNSSVLRRYLSARNWPRNKKGKGTEIFRALSGFFSLRDIPRLSEKMLCIEKTVQYMRNFHWERVKPR